MHRRSTVTILFDVPAILQDKAGVITHAAAKIAMPDRCCSCPAPSNRTKEIPKNRKAENWEMEKLSLSHDVRAPYCHQCSRKCGAPVLNGLYMALTLALFAGSIGMLVSLMGWRSHSGGIWLLVASVCLVVCYCTVKLFHRLVVVKRIGYDPFGLNNYGILYAIRDIDGTFKVTFYFSCASYAELFASANGVRVSHPPGIGASKTPSPPGGPESTD